MAVLTAPHITHLGHPVLLLLSSTINNPPDIFSSLDYSFLSFWKKTRPSFIVFAPMTQSTTATCTHRGESSSILGKMRLPKILNPVTWPYASGSELDSVGRFLGTVSLYRILSIVPVRLDCWEATGPARRVFSNRLGLEIAEYLDCNSDLCESGSIFHMSLYMVGASRSRAKPTLMFVSGDAKVRKDAFNTIKQSKILDAFPGFALAHIPLEAEYENFQQLAGVKGETRIDQTTTSDTSPNVSVLTAKDSGNSGRRLYFSDEIDGKNRERVATAGGIVSFHGRPMFLTVCHAASDTYGPDRQKQADEDDKGEITGFSELELESQESGDGNLVVVTSRGSESPKSSLSSADENSSVFSSPAESTESPRESTQQNPPEPAPRYPQTLGKTTVQAGHVVVSSSEWDCLLVSVHWSLLPDASLGQNTSQGELPWIPLENYSAMIEHEAQDTRITTTTPDGGTIEGILSGTPSFVRLPFSNQFKQIYTATFDKPLAPGDCGCWVRDATTGKLFGHVIAGSPTTGLATIIPASRLFPYLLSQLEGKAPDQASSTSQIADKRLSSEAAAEPAKPVNTNSKKRRASGGLQGVWSSFKKTTGSKGARASVGPCKAENATDVVSKTLAESTVVATTDLVPQDDKKLEQNMKDAENQKDSTNPVPLASLSSLFPDFTLDLNPSPYDIPSPTHTFPEIPYSTAHIRVGGPSEFLHDESWPSHLLYDNDGSYPPSLSMTRDSSATSVMTPSPELVLQPMPVRVVQYAGVYSNEYSFLTGFESDLKGPEFVDPSLIHPGMRSTMVPRPHPQVDPTSVAAGEYEDFGSSPYLIVTNGGLGGIEFPSPLTPAPSDKDNEKQRCPHPDCGKVFKDLKSHMLTHQTERPLKCPIATCEYHVKGFARRYDKNRHVLSHFKGTMVCGFCPGSGSAAERSFNRADVFKRHLTAVHGVEQTPPNSRKKQIGSSTTIKKLTGYAPDATGKCSICEQTFTNAQDFYEHLDDCVLRIVQKEDPAEAINARRLAEVENDPEVRHTLERNSLPTGTSPIATGNENRGAEEDEDDDMPDFDDEAPIANQKGGETPSRGLTHSRGGLQTNLGGRKNRRQYPSSWGFGRGGITMKERVMTVFSGQPRRLAKDDIMLPTEQEVRVTLSDGKSHITDLDVATLKRAQGFLDGKDGQTGPWISDDPTGKDTSMEECIK